MQLVTKDVDCAARTVLHLMRNRGRWIASREIAREQGIPLSFLRRVLHVLIRNGILLSREGAWGGVRLSKRGEDVRLAGLMRLYQGRIQISGCRFRGGPCPNRGICPLRKRLKRIEDKLVRELESVRLRDLAGAAEDGGRQMTGKT